MTPRSAEHLLNEIPYLRRKALTTPDAACAMTAAAGKISAIAINKPDDRIKSPAPVLSRVKAVDAAI